MSKEGRQKALETTLAGLNKRYGEGVVMKLGDASRLAVEAIPTGSLSLDIALGVGGVPRGRIIEIYGPESSGKTTLCLHMIAEAQKQGGICGFVDVEHALDPVYAAKIGVDVNNLYISQPDTGEQALEIAEALVRSDALASAGRTVVAIGDAESVWGLIAVADAVRPEAKEIVAALHAAGIERVVMLTGDNRATAERIAHETGVDEVHAELLPERKVAAVEALVERYGAVAMIGDGVNDAPAMARANLGVAMGAIGSDAAIETADIALMQDDLSRLPWLIRHSKATLGVIRQNIAFSIGVKAVFTILTVLGAASLWGAIAADVGASLLVVLNGLRLINREQA